MSEFSINGKLDPFSFSKRELRETIVSECSLEPYRADQIFDWLMKNPSENLTDISTLSKAHKETVASKFYSGGLKILKRNKSSDGSVKYLFGLYDYDSNEGNAVESVFMRYHHGNTVCVSTQVGCRMGCKFCASTVGGLVRNLLPGEILLQVLQTERDTGEKISNIVLMGIGEPLDNFANVVKFLRLINSEDGMNIGFRHISLSTCGLCDKIIALQAEGIPLTLSVSLHAPNDEIRRDLMPVARKFDYNSLIETCKNYIEASHRRISFEYAMIRGVNDSPSHAESLALKLKGMLCHVNLIPLNETIGSELKPSDRATVEKFRSTLEKYGINATVRRKIGGDVNASCGQLRSSHRK
ncbi:putative dual-specificity RNA methyltransferase RlmN [Clostridia bacterium]|nr:putative dual-specificity RNA methyltransferase RlmN [Clostridia bacterium]